LKTNKTNQTTPETDRPNFVKMQAQQPLQKPLYSTKSWHVTKIVFESLALTFAIIALGVSLALALDYFGLMAYAVLWTAPQAGITIIWAIAEFITICARRNHQGIHPGAHVALHLLLWLGYAASLGLNGYFLALAATVSYWYYGYDDYDDYYGYSGYSNYYGYTAILPLMQALAAFCALLL
jgi:hypothetical protein